MALKNLTFFKMIYLNSLIILLLATAFVVLPGSRACAVGVGGGGANAPTSCDPEYMDALEARAYMEAQREISMNKNLIFKPDSVLEYTCFDNFLAHLAVSGLFSEAGCCGITGLGSSSLDNALSTAVAQAMYTYLTNNFPHSNNNGFLNGRTATQYDVSQGWGQTYTCDMMGQIWTEAKCMNFFEEDDHDAFYDFAWYYTNDPRKWDLTQDWTPNNTCGQGFISAAETSVAYNNQQANYVLPQENPWPSDLNPYVDDPINPYFSLLLPFDYPFPDGSGTVKCAPPILTGVCVDRGPNMNPYPDAVCPNPGCHYEPSATSCTGTVSANDCKGP